MPTITATHKARREVPVPGAEESDPVHAATEEGTARVTVIEQNKGGLVQQDVCERTAADRVDRRDGDNTEPLDTGIRHHDRSYGRERRQADCVGEKRKKVLVGGVDREADADGQRHAESSESDLNR